MNIRMIALLGMSIAGPTIIGVGIAQAAVTATEAQQLGQNLTQFGAQKAGSADGAIPAYTGGIAAMNGLPHGGPDTGYPDPFASEKPVFSVTGANMSQYAAMLTPGAQALLQRYPDFRMDVYPTHRTASYPDWVLQDTVKNATAAQMIGDSDGVSNSYGGIPFPIPHTGYEVMWNTFLRYHPALCSVTPQAYLVDSSGAVTDLGDITINFISPEYDPQATALKGKFWSYQEAIQHSPAAIAGTSFLFEYTVNYQNSDDVTWFYSPGVRRVRVAPEFKYDTPVASYGGAVDFDELQLFTGQMNKFDFHLAGEKEMIVPYNDYKFSNTTLAGLLNPHTINPDGVRWERHRVWVVDATLKPNERHAYSRWTFYIDEDSWTIIATESYDHAGAIYRVGFTYPYQNYSQTGAIDYMRVFGVYDLSKGNYELSSVNTKNNGFFSCQTQMPNMSDFTPQSMAAQSVQ